MCTHYVCFERKYLINQNFSNEIFIFFLLKKSLYIAWASFRIKTSIVTMSHLLRFGERLQLLGNSADIVTVR